MLLITSYYQTVDMHIFSSIGPAGKRMEATIPSFLLNLVLSYADYRLIIIGP